MEIKIELEFTESYYREYYSEWLTYRSRKKYQPVGAFLLIVFAFSISFFTNSALGDLVGGIFSIFGIYELFDFYYSKRKWLSDRRKSKMFGRKATLKFKDDKIEHESPFSEGKSNWEGMINFKNTPNGIFLIPDVGMSIYIPNSKFNPPESKEILIQKLSD